MFTLRKRVVACFLLFAILFSGLVPAAAYIVSTDWAVAIDDYAYQVDVDTSAEIVVCVFPSLFGHGVKNNQGNEINDIVELGVHIFNIEPLDVPDGTQTGVGKKGKDNGVLVLFAVEEQQWRIEVGYGLEGDLTDIESNRIAQQFLVPQLQQENYGEGLYDTVVAIAAQIPFSNQTNSDPIRGAYFYESDATSTGNGDSGWSWFGSDFYGLPLWLVIVLALLGVAVPIYGGGRRSRGGRSGGGGSSGRYIIRVGGLR
jgi:hypothetical protein